MEPRFFLIHKTVYNNEGSLNIILLRYYYFEIIYFKRFIYLVLIKYPPLYKISIILLFYACLKL